MLVCKYHSTKFGTLDGLPIPTLEMKVGGGAQMCWKNGI